ncbi:filamentous hemagglutinin N-terminal domain-containing protein, partial [Saccharibacter floricola]
MMRSPLNTHNNGTEVYGHFSALRRVVNLACAFIILFGSTISPVFAQQAAPHIVVDPTALGPHPTLEKTQNGIDQVDIATPNGAGVSHNTFRNYNVSSNGIVLNNAPHNIQTKIGGAILGNANLNGHSAHVILNEVSGSLPSQIAGYTEVAGQQAAVILANPNGLTCNGCGFINTSRVTLTTGRPNLDAQGNVRSFYVNGGAVAFEGRGADFTAVPILDILSRSVKIAAPVNAQKVAMVLGRNQVAYGSNTPTALADDGTKKPEWALDTAAMGGLYANSIYMVVNEAGAGVRVDGTMASNAGDMHLDGQGNLVLNGQMASSGQLDSSISGTTHIGTHGAMVAQENLTLNSKGDLINSGVVAAHDGGVHLTSGSPIVNSGTIASYVGPVVVHSADRITNSGTVNAQSGRGEFQADALSNQGEIFTHDGLIVGLVHDLDNHDGTIGSVLGAVVLTGGVKDTFNNDQGKITAQSGDVTISTGQLSNNGGTIQGNGTVTATLGSYGS